MGHGQGKVATRPHLKKGGTCCAEGNEKEAMGQGGLRNGELGRVRCKNRSSDVGLERGKRKEEGWTDCCESAQRHYRAIKSFPISKPFVNYKLF
jgi:hypothetical protein